jgi:hypothetical protein
MNIYCYEKWSLSWLRMPLQHHGLEQAPSLLQTFWMVSHPIIGGGHCIEYPPILDGVWSVILALGEAGEQRGSPLSL